MLSSSQPTASFTIQSRILRHQMHLRIFTLSSRSYIAYGHSPRIQQHVRDQKMSDECIALAAA